MMTIGLDSTIFKGAVAIKKSFGVYLPTEFTGPEDEFLAGRRSAWLGVCLNTSPVYDVYGPDAVTFLNHTCVNKDFTRLDYGASKHVLVCNEYFFQIDGPKSLEIMEKACQCDLHDLKFARNKKVKIGGTDMVVHRHGMSGALAYEVHGAARDTEIVYTRIREVVKDVDGRMQGASNYVIINHTVGGYPNQFQHFWYPYSSSGEGLAEFARKSCFQIPFSGSASDNENNFYVTPYDVGWGYLVNFAHDFMGKEALMEIAKNPPRKMVTLEWNTEDVGDVFMSQFRGKDVKPYEGIEYPSNVSHISKGICRGDYVQVDGKKIGVATGRTYAYYERKMISLASIDKKYAIEGNEVIVLWGSLRYPQKEIRAKVARFPYFNEEYRNETFDVEKIPHPVFK
jgi:glycine cleavage system aminomethyltransferase T